MPQDRWKAARSSRDHYLRNSTRLKALAAESKNRQRVLLRDYVIDWKQRRACADCGRSYPHYVMEFDHVKGSKRGNVSDLISRAVSFAVLRLEISKCELVCANCHRERTWQRSTPQEPAAAAAAQTSVPSLF